MAKITIVEFKGLTHSISYTARTTTCTVLASAAQANTTPMQKPNSVTGQACLSSTVLTVHNILLPAGVIGRIALKSLCHRYSDRNVSLSTLKSPSFRAFVLLYCCIDIRTKSNKDECGKFITQRTHNFVTFSFVMPWSTSTRIEAQPELSTRQQQHKSPRCPASVCLQDSKTERTYKYT